MATRLKVDRNKLISVLDSAQKAIDERIAAQKKEEESWNWRKEASKAVSLVKAEAGRKEATEESFTRVWNNAKKTRPTNRYGIRSLEDYKKDIQNFKDLVAMSDEQTFSLNTGDSFVSGILHLLRSKK